MSLWVSALTVMAMDVRHLLYGPALRHRIVSRMSPGKTAMWAFGLTDEVFAAATARLMRNNRSWSENWMLGIALCSWLSWVAGTALGALFGNGPLEQFPVIEASLAFMLPALFLSFLLAAFRRPQSLTIAAALAGALLGVVLFSIPVAILAGIGAGCVAALFQPALRRPTMNTDVLVIGLVVGCANYLFRYLPLRLAPARAQPGLKRGKAALLLDSIGIASICALLVVSSAPVVMREPAKLLPTLVGFAALALCFYRSKASFCRRCSARRPLASH